MRLGAVQLDAPPLPPENSLFGRTNPCSGQNDSLFPGSRELDCKLLNPLGDRLPKPSQKVKIARNF
jgi:hypothetical protein